MSSVTGLLTLTHAPYSTFPRRATRIFSKCKSGVARPLLKILKLEKFNLHSLTCSHTCNLTNHSHTDNLSVPWMHEALTHPPIHASSSPTASLLRCLLFREEVSGPLTTLAPPHYPLPTPLHPHHANPLPCFIFLISLLFSISLPPFKFNFLTHVWDLSSLTRVWTRLCLLQWSTEPKPLSHQGSPSIPLFKISTYNWSPWGAGLCLLASISMCLE